MSLSKSKRIKLLKEVADHLSKEEWSIIDLTLSQFDVPTNSVWSGSSADYVLTMAKGSDDETLIGLAEHLGISFEGEPVADIHPPFWEVGALRLFITHLAMHRKLAGELQECFERFGVSAFVAHNDIEPTKEWQTEIEVALATCDALIALLHPDFHKSNWTDQEVGFAMGRGVPIFSVGLGQAPYGFIGKFQAFNGVLKTTSDLAREMFDALRKHKQTRHKMADVLVRLFEKSPNFDAAKVRIGYLEDLNLWKSSFSRRIKDAAESNSQISQAWGVPDRITSLVEKWKKKVQQA
jgi:hypothetical protein